jgi:hypothetical protein
MDKIKKVYDCIINLLFHNVPFFIATCIGILALAITLLIYGSCLNKTIAAPDMVMYPLERTPTTFPLKLYVNDEFSDKQIEIMQQAANDWNKFSDGLVVIELVKNFEPPTYFSENFYKNYEKHTIWMKTGNEEEVARLFIKYSIVGDGFNIGNFIVVVNPFNKLDDNTLRTIFSHEIGHALALEHIKPQYEALMNPGGNQGRFTKNDAIVFCYLYKCDVNKFK